MTVGRIPNVEGGIQPTLLTTTGDIIYASSASNPARLGIGSSAQVLTVASGVPSWATPASGGYTSIATGTLSSTITTISSIDQSYRNLYLVIVGPYVNIATSMRARINGISTSVYTNMRFNGSATWTFTGSQSFLNLVEADLPTVTHFNTATLEILNYATTSLKRISSGYNNNNADGTAFMSSFNNFTDSTAVTSISLLTGNGTSTFSGGSYTLYGVK